VQEAWVRALVALPFALAIGSFMTVVASRVPAHESIVSPGSRCPRCGTPLRPRDNVPILGWMLLRGRCRSCHQRISVVYPILEATTAAGIVGAFWLASDPWVAFATAGLVALLPAISAIDVAHRIIPNAIVYPSLVGFPLFLVIASLAGGPVDLGGMAIGFAAYGGGLFVVALISGGMGMGDVKLAAVIGAVLGAVDLPLVGVAAGAAIVLGGLGAVVALLLGKGRKAAIPFGPYLAAGAAVAVFWGDALARWYADRLLG
jgi:leader peptidase (prepilin peptidase)/N-methyltransferase